MLNLSLMNLILVGIPVVGIVGLLGFFGWNRTMRRRLARDLAQEQERRAAILQGGASLRSVGQRWLRATGRGQIALLVDGTFGARRLPYLLESYDRADAGGHIGLIFLLELDIDEVQMCLDNVPPAYRERIVTLRTLLPGGLLGATPQEATAAYDEWGYDVSQATDHWLSRMQAETEPVLLLSFLSPGGMGVLGQPVIDAFKERYPGKPVFSVSVLDHKSVVRHRFPELRALYARDQQLRGSILLDNRRDLDGRFDLGIVLLFSAMSGGTWIDSQPLAIWNGLAHIFPSEQPGGYATISVWSEMLPISYLPTWEDQLPELFFTRGQLVIEKARRGIKLVAEDPSLQSLPVPPAAPGATRICYVIAPIIPEPDFKALAERITQSLAQWRQTHDENLLIHFASLGTPLTPDTREVPLVVVLVQAVDDRGVVIDALARETVAIDPMFLPQTARARLTELSDGRRPEGVTR